MKRRVSRSALLAATLLLGCRGTDAGEGVELEPTRAGAAGADASRLYAELEPEAAWAQRRGCAETFGGARVCDCEQLRERTCMGDGEFVSELQRHEHGYEQCALLYGLQGSSLPRGDAARAGELAKQLSTQLSLASFSNSLTPQLGPEALGTAEQIVAASEGALQLSLEGDSFTLTQAHATMRMSVWAELDVDADGELELLVRIVEDFERGCSFSDRYLVVERGPGEWRAAPFRPSMCTASG